MASIEEDFPRGGTAKKPSESKIVVNRTEVDNLFQVQLITFFFVYKLIRFRYSFHPSSHWFHTQKMSFLLQTNEQTETKKRKGPTKDDNIKVKKKKTGKEEGNGLVLNSAVKCVEILHYKVSHSQKHIYTL